MKNKTGWAKNLLGALLGLILGGSLHGATVSYHFLKEIPVGGESKWDYLTLDPSARRLYVAHSSKVEVIDLDKEAVIAAISPTPGVHGFALAPDLKRGFSSNGTEAKSSVVDLDTLQTLSQVPTGEKPDCILYEPGAQDVYTFDGIAKSVTVFKAKTGSVRATIPLPGKPEFARADPKAGLVFVNIEDQNEVVVINTQTHKIANIWPVTPGESPSSMAIDLANHRLFIGCRNKVMVVMDDTNGKIVTSLPIGAGVDATVFDPTAQLIFNSCGDGTTTILHEDNPGHFTSAQTLTTVPGARTMAEDPTTRKIYLAAATGDKSDQADRPPKKSFKVLVYGP